jgi:hypothetical protein
MREQVALLRLVGRYDADLRAVVVYDPRPVMLARGRSGSRRLTASTS